MATRIKMARLRRRRRALKVLKLLAGVLVALGVGAAGAVSLLVFTTAGNSFVVERVLRRIEGTINGEIVVSGLRSPRLDRGARLLGVQVMGPAGDTILAVDSIDAAYSIRTMLSGDVVLTDLTLWRPRLTITKEALGQPFNLSAFLDGSNSVEMELGDVDQLSEAGVRLLFEQVEIQDGVVDVRYPVASLVDPASLLLSEPGPDGQSFIRVFGFSGINGHIGEVVAADPAADGLRMNVRDLAFEGRVIEEPVRVENLTGRVAWVGNRIEVDVETAGLLGATVSGSGAAELAEGQAPEVTMEGLVDGLDLSELRWLEPRLPDSRASARLAVQYGSGGLRMRWSDGRLPLGGGDVEGEGAVSLSANGVAVLQDVALDLSAVPVTALAEVLQRTLPVEGRLSGNVQLSGTLDSMMVASRLDLVEPGVGPTRSEIEGMLHFRRPFGVTGLTARLTPVDLGLINRLAEGLLLDGSVDLDVQADGTMDTGISVVAEATYPDPNLETSYVVVHGILTEIDGETWASFEGDLSPLSIPGVFGEESPLSRLGLARGTIRAEGPLSDFVLQGDLTTEGGRLTLESSFDFRAPFASYRVRGEAYEYDVLEIAPSLPEGTVLSGVFDLQGEGGDLATAELVVGISLNDSRFADLTVDSASVDMRISNGMVTMDNVRGRIGDLTVEGGGQLATAGEGPSEGLRVSFETQDLEGLRPLLLGTNVIAGDTLTFLERQILEFEGVDPDTLRTLSEALVSGRMAGEVAFTGSFENMSATGRADLEDGSYGGNRLGRAGVAFSVTDLLSPERDLSVEVDASGVRLFEREFDSVSVSFDYRQPSGNADVILIRSNEESYLGRLAFEEEGGVRILHLDELVFRFPEERWNLGGPSTISWDPDGLTFQDFRMRRPGVGGMRIQAQGRFPFNGEADFRLQAEALDVGWVAHALQLDDVLQGVVDLNLLVRGTDVEPVMALELSADRFRFREYEIDRLEADVDYAARRAVGSVGLWNDSQQVLTVAGELPLDLSFNLVEQRLPEESIDLVVVSDELPLSLAMAPFESFDQVTGTMSGSVDVGGTLRSLAPRGQLTVDAGGAFVTGLGVRHRDVSGTLDWFPDGRLEVDLGARAGGTGRIEGTVTLATAFDPEFDLDLHFDAFQAVDRRDVTGLLSGDVRLEGSYSRPVVSGDLSVDEGTVFWEEFQRVAQVSDLFFERSARLADFSVIDTTAASIRPFIAGQNIFLENFRMENTTLTVRRDSWIRSETMNVELDGELDVLYDRLSQDLALVGSLEAVRGSYALSPLENNSTFQRQFQVDGGTVRFLGTPGIDPDLDITATYDIRTPEGDRFAIVAGVTGTLVSPRVALSSDEPGFSEDDLLSYLWFGRPSYALSQDQSQAFGASMATLGLSGFSNQLGMAVSQELGLGLDYLSITQQDLGGFGDFGGALSTTVIETGFYVGDFFLTLLLRPPAGQTVGSDRWPGLRFEWAPSDDFTIESYFEDRFFRGRAVGIGELGVQSEKGLGLSIFREWAY